MLRSDRHEAADIHYRGCSFKSLHPHIAQFLMTFDGAFVAGSVKADDGLVPGTYRVTIECWKEQPGHDGTPGKSHVPEAYSPPDLDVQPDANSIRYDVDVSR